MNSFSYFKITHTGLVFLASRVPSSPRARARSASSSTCLRLRRKSPEMPGAVHPVDARRLVKCRAKATQGLQGSEDFVTPEKPSGRTSRASNGDPQIAGRRQGAGVASTGEDGSLFLAFLCLFCSLCLSSRCYCPVSLSLCARQRLVKTSLMIVVQRRPFKLSHGTVLNRFRFICPLSQ